MGLFATQRSKDTIAQGLRESSSPLQLDGNIFLRVNGTNMRVEAIILPLRAMGVKYVPMGTNQTVVSISIPGTTARASIYQGVNNEASSTWSPQNKTFDNLVIKALNKTGISGWIYDETYTDYYTDPGCPHPNATIAYLLVENSDGDEALDASEKGFLVITLNCTAPTNEYAQPRDVITIEIRVEKSAPLTIEFMVPESLTKGVWTMVSG